MFENEFGYPNWLAAKHRVVVTRTGKSTDDCVSTVNGRTVIKSGAVWPKNNADAIGIVVNQVDVTDKDVPIAVMVEGYVYSDRLPAEIAQAAAAVFPEIKEADYNTTEPLPPTEVDIVSAVEDGGTAGAANSTSIVITFDEDVVGLKAANITLTSDTGSATKGALTGSAKVWTLAITPLTEGNVKILVSGLAGYTFPTTPEVVAIYAANA